MAANGLFTYEDLYAGQSSNYHHRLTLQLSSLYTSDPRLNGSIATTTNISSTQIQSTTKLNKLADVIPFTYFYWILVILAILLALTLVIVFICYCHTFVENYRNQRGSITSFYRNRTTNQRIHTQNAYQKAAPSFLPTVPSPPPPPPPPPRSLPTPPCPSKSLKCIDDQLYGQHLDVNDSPSIARHDVYLKKPLSTFASSTPSSSSGLQSRLSGRSSDFLPNMEQLYESQRASMVMNNDPESDSLIIDMN